MSNLKSVPDIEDQIQRIRLAIEEKRAKKNMPVNGNNLGNIGIQRDTTRNVFTTLESDLGELRTQDGNSVRQRQSFDWKFENEINRKELIENKSIIQEYQRTSNGNQFISYRYIRESKHLDDITKEPWLKFQNESTKEIVIWNGTFTTVSKFQSNRIAIRKWKEENGAITYNDPTYTFIDILADDTGMPIISK